MAADNAMFWPPHAARHLTAPATSLYYNAEVSARRYPDKPFMVYYDSPVTFGRFLDETRKMAGYLQRRLGIGKGDRVLLFMQNSPQFVIAYYAILRANAIVVPLNPMNLSAEVQALAQDADSGTMVVSQELFPRAQALLQLGVLKQVIVTAYSDYLTEPTTLNVPDFVSAPRTDIREMNVTLWMAALAADHEPRPLTTGPDDLCVMPYTSGTTGVPKGVMHSHRTVMHTAVSMMAWFAMHADLTLLAVAPFFHVTGMQGSMNGPLFMGCTIVMLSRWDRDTAARCVERYSVTSFTAVPTMIQDFYANPRLGQCDLSSIQRLSGGGAAMPAAIAHRLASAGITYIEGYGLTETMSATHLNPPLHPKAQCLGVPIFGVEAKIIDPVRLTEVAPGEIGEIIIRGPQVMLGYWRRPADTADAFVTLEGKRFFRSGDMGRVDGDGFFFIVDRIKRMINASGFKVWPTEVEALLYEHPAVQEACIISSRDEYRGETVKAVIVLKPAFAGTIEPVAISDWARGVMSAYKVPRVVEFTEALPKSGSGKIMWRELQERENSAAAPHIQPGLGTVPS
jgi:fatty-acyl-CoA synthase